jgi:hypothetical protein
MGIIFDDFPTIEEARRFVARIRREFGRRATAFEDQDAMEAPIRKLGEKRFFETHRDHEGDLSAFELEGPVALISYGDGGYDEFSYEEDCDEFATVARDYGGRGAGT